jgi:polyvinyl alcohol dehydrogenase (cytochrome)
MKGNSWFAPLAILIALALLSASALAEDDHGDGASHAQWRVAGQNPGDTRSQPNEHRISKSNVGELTPKWVFTTAGSVSATPTIAGNAVYFPDWAGNLYAVDKNSGKQLWSTKVSDYDGVAGALSRVSPVVFSDEIIFGDITGQGGTNLIAVDRHTGVLRWITRIESHNAAIVTGSPVVFKGIVYQGVSSSEEGRAISSSYPCCTFRGSVVALNASTGEQIWKTYDMPDNLGATDQYSGGAIWQPPAINPERGLLYVGTGNNYTVPAAVEHCQAADPAATNCAAPEDYFDSTLALDLKTGAVKWARHLQGYDAYTLACLNPNQGISCPSPAGPDYDLSGSGPNFVDNFLGIGQKSGIYWSLNPNDGSVRWGTPVGPAGTLGGIQWGTATDGKRVYVAITNNEKIPYTLMSGQTITWGAWSALDPGTGKILWQTPDPTRGALDMGALSVANGVVYAGSFSGTMYALDAATGKILWSFASGGSVIDGPAIADGVVYWGSGYPKVNGIENNKVYAFSLPHGHEEN